MELEQEIDKLKHFYQTNLQLLTATNSFKENPDQICLAVESICNDLESKGLYVRMIEVTTPQNKPLKLELELTPVRPVNYSYECIAFFFLRVVNMCKAVGNLIITGIRFEEGRPDVIITLSEDSDNKTCAFDFKSTGIKDNGFENYFKQ